MSLLETSVNQPCVACGCTGTDQFVGLHTCSPTGPAEDELRRNTDCFSDLFTLIDGHNFTRTRAHAHTCFCSCYMFFSSAPEVNLSALHNLVWNYNIATH